MRTPLIAAVLILILVPTIVFADDWPHWMGPQRDNVWRETGILEKFPEGGPEIVWRTPVAGGYAGPAVAAGRVFVTDFVTQEDTTNTNFDRNKTIGTERVLCLDRTTGSELWRHEYPVQYTISYPAGPRCTPAVDGNRVYTLGAEGNLFCFDTETGNIIWSSNLPEKYNTKPALWGYASHPLIDGNKLICIVGGKGSHTVAFDKNTGNEIWRTGDAPEQGYSPPTIIQAEGVRQLLLVRPDAITSVNPETGERYWSVPYEATSGSVIMTPIHWQNYLYVGGYSNQNLLMKLSRDPPGAEVEWGNKAKHAISPVNVQPMEVDGTMYGFDQNGKLYGIEIPTGKRLWETTKPISKRHVGSGTAFIYRQADRYWLFSENGDLIICKLSPTGYEELDRAHILEPTNVAFGRDVVWCAPAFAGGKMFVRNGEEIVCVKLGQ